MKTVKTLKSVYITSSKQSLSAGREYPIEGIMTEEEYKSGIKKGIFEDVKVEAKKATTKATKDTVTTTTSKAKATKAPAKK